MEHQTILRRSLILLGAVGIALIGAAALAAERGQLNGIPLRGKRAPVFSYPPPLVRSGVSGRVALAYSVGVDGKPYKITVFVSDDSRLEAPAIDLLKGYEFDVPKTWEVDGGPWRRFHVQVDFTLQGDPPRQKLVEDGEVLTVAFAIVKDSPGAVVKIKPGVFFYPAPPK